MMDNAILKEIGAIQTDMVRIEGMLEALAAGAYGGTRTEYIGNSLEILVEYLGHRADRLDMLCPSFPVMHGEGDDATGESLSDKCSSWEEFAADGRNWELRSGEVMEAYAHMAPYLELLPGDGREALCLVIGELEAASRKQGFMEGYSIAAGRCAGDGGEDSGGA